MISSAVRLTRTLNTGSWIDSPGMDTSAGPMTVPDTDLTFPFRVPKR